VYGVPIPQAEVQVLVNSKEAPEVYNMGADDLVSVGPFDGEGLDMRSSGIQGLFRWVAEKAGVLSRNHVGTACAKLRVCCYASTCA
jgi:hypothetical protein